MNSAIDNVRIPPAPMRPAQIKRWEDIHHAIGTLHTWIERHIAYLNPYLQKHADQLNTQVQGFGANLASAATITITNPHHHVTGTKTIITINPPSGFSGPVWLFADGAFRFGTGGNIARAQGPFAIGQVVNLVYDPNVKKWGG